MADGGVIEGALLSAAIGAGTSAITGGDPLKGALMGGISGGVMGGLSGAGTGLGSATPEAVATQLGVEGAATGPYSQAAMLAEQNAGMGMQGLESIRNAAATATPINTVPAGYENFTDITVAGPSMGTQAPLTSDMITKTPVTSPNFLGYSPLTNTQLGMTAAGAGISGLMSAERDKYGVPTPEKYTGPLSRFTYNPTTYQPDIVRPPSPAYRPVYAADGGLMDGGNQGIAGLSANPSYPMADQQASRYAVASQMPVSAEQTRMANLPPVPMAEGGHLGGYSDGGRMLRGPGDGMSDSIPASISGRQPARLADGEFVVPADVVSHLGNGSTDAGAKKLYAMMDKVRQARTGKKKQAPAINANKAMPA